MNLLKKIRAAYHQWQVFRYYRKLQQYQDMRHATRRAGDFDLYLKSGDYEKQLRDKAAQHHAKWLAASTKGEGESNA